MEDDGIGRIRDAADSDLTDVMGTLHENMRLEAKRAKGGLPRSIWETYSAFANSEGGVILLGVSEDADHNLSVTGVEDAEGMVRDFWNTVNDRSKASATVVTDRDVQIRRTPTGDVVSIMVPRAMRSVMPVYIGPDPFEGTYRRNGEGDYRCERHEVLAMMRDSEDRPRDRRSVDSLGVDALDGSTVAQYRRSFQTLRPGHPWHDLPDEDFLMRLEALVPGSDGVLRPSAAGLLMFGRDWLITEEFPDYSLDYREDLGGEGRWDDRITSGDGSWPGNLYTFWLMANERMRRGVAHPFRLGPDMVRIDDNPMDSAVREALTNTIVHADYLGRRGTVIVRRTDRIEFSNPGGLRLSHDEVVRGGVSDCRNPTLMKMFNLVGIGEKAGSGFDTMRAGCRFADTPEPELSVETSPDRVTLVLHHFRAPSDNVSAAVDHAETGVPSPGLTQQERSILGLLKSEGALSTPQVAERMGLGPARIRRVLAGLVASGHVEALGQGRARRYQASR